jgi:hypothetical protein
MRIDLFWRQFVTLIQNRGNVRPCRRLSDK